MFYRNVNKSVGFFTLGAANGQADSFGVIALVAMMPLIAIQIMGIIFKVKQKKQSGGEK